MAKSSWIKIDGQWEECKAVYMNINGVWKRIVPKGNINGAWKPFIEYFVSKIVIQYKELIGITSFDSTINYNSDGYTGTLSKCGNVERLGNIVVGGSYTPASSKSVTRQPSSYYNIGGYSGTLTRYIYSGNYTPSKNKTVGTSRNVGYYHVISSGCSHHKVSPGKTPSSSIGYNSEGFNGTLNLTGVNAVGLSSSSCSTCGAKYTFYTALVANYSGTVTKPTSDTRVYRYKGMVTKPACDTRVWKTKYRQKYEGEVRKPI